MVQGNVSVVDSKAADIIRSITRPVVTLMLVGTACAGFLLGKIDTDQFVPLATAATAFWFAARGDSH